MNGGVSNKGLVLAAMVFAVAMTFIDQTIVAIAIPNLQKDLSLSATGSQWIINGYLLALSALFAFGGKLGDVLGRRRMVVIGVLGFAITSACCGLTPTGSIAQAWIITFRVLQGATAALLFPAAVAIVVASFPLRERGKAMAIFFGISGGLTAIGPAAGGYLTQWTWRAIFWINIPVAIIALVLIWISKPENERRPTKLDYRGTVLITGAMGLIVLGLQQSAVWGWSSFATWASIVIGVILMVAFVAVGAADPRAAAAPADLPRPRLLGRDRDPRNDLGRVRAVLLLRQRVRPGVAGRELLACWASTSSTSSSGS